MHRVRVGSLAHGTFLLSLLWVGCRDQWDIREHPVRDEELGAGASVPAARRSEISRKRG